jgi:MFS family permease
LGLEIAISEPASEPTTESRASGSQRGFKRTFEAFRYRDFRFLWFAHMSNSAAQWMQMIGLPILVIIVTESPIHLGAVMLARTVPAIVFGIFSGVVADMWNRRTILLTTRAVGTLLAVWFAAVNVTGSVGLTEIYSFAILRGVVMSFDQAPRRAVIPSMVPPHVVVNAMALTNGGAQIMRVTAASFAGTIVALWGIETAFVALAIFYVVGIPFLLALQVADHERGGYRGVRVMLSDAKAGIAFAVGTPAMRGSLVIAGMFFIFGMSFTNVFAPVLASGPLGLTEGGLGWLIAVMGAGGTTGTFAVAYFSPSHHRGIILTLSLGAFGFLLAGMAGVTYLSTPVFAFVMIYFVGVGQSLFMPLLSTIVLQAAPEHMRGRAMAVLSWDRALVSFGSVVAGFSIAAFGSQAALLGFAAACVFGALMLLSSGVMRKID